MKIKSTVDRSEELFDELKKIYKETTGESLPSAKKYKKGECLYEEGSIPKGIFYLKSGSVKVSHNTLKKPVSIRLALAHDFIGYLSLIKHWDYVTTATAVEDVQVYFIPKKIFFKALNCDNKLTILLLDILCNRIVETDKKLLDMLTKDVCQRLSLLLLSLNDAKLQESSHVDGMLHIPKKDLASILNINAETMSRNLAKLVKEKAITLHSKKSAIEIISKQKLLQLSQLDD